MLILKTLTQVKFVLYAVITVIFSWIMVGYLWKPHRAPAQGEDNLVDRATYTKTEENQNLSKDCNAPKGWEKIAQSAEHKVLIFGEIHGTIEVPDFFSRYVCAASQRGGKTYVFVEYPASIVGDTFNKARIASDPRAHILKMAPKMWQFKDGRDSQAMLDMIVNTLLLENVTIIPYIEDLDLIPPDGLKTEQEVKSWREGLMDTPEKLQNLVEGLHSSGINKRLEGADRYIVLVGNIHARKAQSVGFLEGGDYMASRLDIDTISLKLIYEGGSYRNHETKISQLRSTADKILSARAGNDEIGLFDKFLPAYDGYFYIKKLNPSPNAVVKE